MFFTNLIKSIYGQDTRSMRVLNFFTHIAWLLICVSTINGSIDINVPVNNVPTPVTIIYLSLITIVISLMSFMRFEYRIRCKFISLLFGSVTQALIATKYITAYPPFSLMIIVCSILSVWFLGGALLVKFRVEE